MTQLVESRDSYRMVFDQVQRESPSNAGQIGALRERAFTQFAESGFPTTRLEPWRFTNIAPIARTRFALAAPESVDERAIGPYELVGLNGPRVVCVDGRFASQLSRVEGLPAGVEIRSLAEVLRTEPQTVEPYLGRLAGFDGPSAAFTALNTGLLQDGIVVRVPDHTVVERPLHLLFVSTGVAGMMSHPRLLVLVGENSQVQVVESYAGLADAAYLTNAVTEIVLNDSAVVDHYKLLRESVKAYHVGSMHPRLGRHATFSSHAITLGGLIVRNEVMAELGGEGGECTLNGLYLVNGNRLIDNHTTIHHAQPHCNSHELYKGILDDQARAVFNGKIIVAPDAQKTDAKQTNKALLLSEHAQINTKPELEIFADDVRCTHGATIGQLDADALFYLRARGLGEEQARRLLVHAFASDLLNRIAIEPIRDQLDTVLLQQLPGSNGRTS